MRVKELLADCTRQHRHVFFVLGNALTGKKFRTKLGKGSTTLTKSERRRVNILSPHFTLQFTRLAPAAVKTTVSRLLRKCILLYCLRVRLTLGFVLLAAGTRQDTKHKLVKELIFHQYLILLNLLSGCEPQLIFQRFRQWSQNCDKLHHS